MFYEFLILHTIILYAFLLHELFNLNIQNIKITL
jgi:hypothetical protein